MPCLGGYSRILSKVNEIRASVKDSLFMNCGDEFQGVSSIRLECWRGARES